MEENEYDHILSSYENQEFYLIKDNIIYKFSVQRIEDKLEIKNNNYVAKFNISDLSKITKNKIDNISKGYKLLTKLFQENKVIIKSVLINKEIVLKMKVNDEKEKEIKLSYNYEYQDYIINEIKKLKTDINNLKQENNKLKIEIQELRKKHQNKYIKDIHLLSTIGYDSYCSTFDNTFTVFNSINNILYLIYSNYNKSIISYDLNQQILINEIRKAHRKNISNLKHYLDKINNRDLILSISFKDNNLKLWDVKNWNNILNIINVNRIGFLASACLINEDNKIHIITSNYNEEDNCEPIKVFDLNGIKINEMNCSNESTFFIDVYYDSISKKNFILTGNENYVKSYDYNSNSANKLYHKYYENNNGSHKSVIINDKQKIIKLIESCIDGNIRVWNFHSGLLLIKINVNYNWLYGLCLWNSNYIFVGCNDKTIKAVEINNGLISKSFVAHSSKVITIKKFIHPKYGECLISQGFINDQIKIWINKK